MTKTNVKSDSYEKWKSTAALMFEGKSKKERLLSVFTAAFFILLGFILCQRTLPLTDRAIGIPQADALLCASSVYTPFVYVGVLIGSLYRGIFGIERLLILSFIFVLRIVTGAKAMSGENGRIFSESVVTKTAVAAIMAFTETGMHLASAGITQESALTAVATLTVLPMLTLVFSTYYAKPVGSRLLSGIYELSLTALFTVTVYCARNFPLSIVSADTLLAVFFTLCVAKHGGTARAGIIGFLLGYTVSPAYFLPYVLLGVSAALTFTFGSFSAVGIAMAVASVSAVLIGSYTALYYTVPDLIISSAAASPIIRYSLLPEGFPYPFNDSSKSSPLTDAQRVVYAGVSTCGALRATSDGLRSISSELSEIHTETDDRSHPQPEITERICSEFCEKCSMCPICLESYGELTREAIGKLVRATVESGGELTDNIPKHLSQHCIKLRELSDFVIAVIDSYSDKYSRSVAPAIGNPPFSALISYTSCADILSSLAESSEKELIFDKEKESAAASVLHKAGISFGYAAVIGATRKKLYLYGADHKKVQHALKDILPPLSKAFGCRMECTEIPTDDSLPIIFIPARKLTAESAVVSLSKEGEQVCGDVALSFSDNDGNFYALLSDGMGSGKSALRSSSMTAALMKNLMLGRVSAPLAIRLTGEVLSMECDECFSTVDLMKLDLVSGKTTVTKSYACASYVLRGGCVYRCDSSSMPIGITNAAAPFETEFILNEGDTVIMLSDGIADCPETETRIPDIVGLSSHLNAKDLASRILDRAVEVSGRRDDMSALVIRIGKAA
jgi:stage II sporulation protein E